MYAKQITIYNLFQMGYIFYGNGVTPLPKSNSKMSMS